MQSLTRSFSRLYATIPDTAAVARTSSTPRAVRLRRQKRRGDRPLPAGEHDARPSGLTPTEFATYQRSRAKGELLDRHGRDISETQWLERMNGRRERIRGVAPLKKKGGEMEMRVVGQRIYLPNIIFRLVRNHTPEGQPYNPYEATFRIPQSVTKTDVRSYLHAVYGVRTTYIRTDNYNSPIYRDRDGSWSRTKSYKTYKRAVVGLVDPFYYPQAVEDMPKDEAEERKKWLEENFQIEATKRLQKLEYLRMTRSGSKNWRWRGQESANRKAILGRIVAKRYERDVLLGVRKKEIQQTRGLISETRDQPVVHASP